MPKILGVNFAREFFFGGGRAETLEKEFRGIHGKNSPKKKLNPNPLCRNSGSKIGTFTTWNRTQNCARTPPDNTKIHSGLRLSV